MMGRTVCQVRKVRQVIRVGHPGHKESKARKVLLAPKARRVFKVLLAMTGPLARRVHKAWLAPRVLKVRKVIPVAHRGHQVQMASMEPTAAMVPKVHRGK